MTSGARAASSVAALPTAPASPAPHLAERSGILKKALDATDEARTRGALTQPESGLELRERLLKGTDMLIRWVREECIADSNAKVSVDRLYIAYRAWMERLKQDDGEYIFPVGKDRFSGRLRSFEWIVDGGRAPRAEGRGHALLGIRLKTFKEKSEEAKVFGLSRASG